MCYCGAPITESFQKIDYEQDIESISSTTASVNPSTTNSLPVLTGSNSEKDIIPIKKIIVNKYPEMADLLIDLNYCEAGGKHSGMYGDHGTSFGGFMFKEATFKQYCKGSRNNFEDQLDCTVVMIKMGYGPEVLGWYNCWRKMNLFKYNY